MSIARQLTQTMKAKGVKRSRNSVFTIVSDDHNVHCMTEDMIDAWWASLSPDEKAVHFECDVNGELYETIALAVPSSERSEFEKYVDQFFADMKRRQLSPFTGLIAPNASPTRKGQEF